MASSRFLLLAAVLPLLLGAPAKGRAQSPAPAGGSPPAGQPAGPLSDADTHWTVGVCALKAVELPPEDAYLTRSLPLLIRERLESILAHTLAPEERRGLQEEILGRERRQLREQLGKAREERDSLLFQDLRAPQREDRLAELTDRVRRLEERLRQLQEAGPESVEVTGEKPVEFLQGKEEGGLLEPPAFAPLRFARQQNAELLIWGELQPLEDYLFLEIRALSAPLEKEIYEYRDAVQREEIYTVLGEVTDRLAELVLGRMWSGLALPGLPADCEVWLDGRFAGTGADRLPYLTPGEHDVRLACPGGREQEARVTLLPGRVKELALELRERPPRMIRLSSQPPGAQVYLGSRYVGTTPLELERPSSRARVLLHRDGFGDTAAYLDAGTPGSLELKLEPLIGDPAAIQAKERRSFYRSFGIWALSFPVPFFLYGMTVDYAIASQAAGDAGDVSDALRLARLGRLSWYSYLGGLTLSAGLFANMAWHLWKYIRAADRKAD